MPLFVVLADGVELDDRLRERIREELRTKASPRHVPDDVIAVPAIPHTRTGKTLEVPVKRLIQGHPLERVANPDAVDSFDTLTYFTRFARSSEASEKSRLRHHRCPRPRTLSAQTGGPRASGLPRLIRDARLPPHRRRLHHRDGRGQSRDSVRPPWV